MIREYVKKFFLKLIRLYQKSRSYRNLFSKLLFLNSDCRFQPSCSEYSYQSLKKYGIIRGCWISVKRIFKCHPWSKGGWDPVK